MSEERNTAIEEAYTATFGKGDTDLPGRPMTQVIRRLFADAERLEDADGKPVLGQAPAIRALVVLRGASIPPIQGALSITPEGALRMLSPVGDGKPQLAEQFFAFEDVVTLVLVRDIVSHQERRIIT